MFISSGYRAHTRSANGRAGPDPVDLSPGPGAPSGTEDHRHARRGLIGRRYRLSARHLQADFAALALQLSHAHAIELDHVAHPPRPRTIGGLLAREHPALALDAHH